VLTDARREFHRGEEYRRIARAIARSRTAAAPRSARSHLGNLGARETGAGNRFRSRSRPARRRHDDELARRKRDRVAFSREISIEAGSGARSAFRVLAPAPNRLAARTLVFRRLRRLVRADRAVRRGTGSWARRSELGGTRALRSRAFDRADERASRARRV